MEQDCKACLIGTKEVVLHCKDTTNERWHMPTKRTENKKTDRKPNDESGGMGSHKSGENNENKEKIRKQLV